MGRRKHPEPLTPAEQRILEELRTGATNVEIAVRLGLSVNTVKYHVANMLAKLDLADRKELARWREAEPSARPFRRMMARWPQILGAGAAVSCLAGLALVFAMVDGTDEPGPPSGTIVFVGAEGPLRDGAELYQLYQQSGQLRQLTDDGLVKLNPVWSPRGEEIVYLALRPSVLPQSGETGGLRVKLTVLRPGREAAVLDEYASIGESPATLQRPAWHPAGDLIAFATQDFITSEIRRDGSGRRDQLLGCISPAWMPGGLGGVCVGYPEEGSHLTLGVLLADAFRWPETRIAGRAPDPTYPTRSYRTDRLRIRPSYSADGQWVAWWEFGGRDNVPPAVFVAPLRDDRTFDPGEAVEVGPGMMHAWSPSGARLVFTSATDLDAVDYLGGRAWARGDLVVYDAGSRQRRTIGEDGSSLEPVWSPDGHWIAFVSDRDHPAGEVYLVRDDGTELHRLTHNDIAETMLDWR